MIQLQNFSIGFGSRILLENVTTDFGSSRLTALIGRNGAGKSTLLRAIAGLNPDYDGRVLVDGENIRSISRQRLARLLAFVTTQRPRIANLTCREVVAVGRSPYTDWIGRLTDADREIVDRSLREVGMEDFADKTLDRMSDGECQRVMIARALAQSTPAILLDEPTSFLDMPNRYDLVGLLGELAHIHGKTVVFSTHELDIAVEMCDSIALVDDRSLRNLPVAEMLAGGHIQRLFSSSRHSLDPLTGHPKDSPVDNVG